MFSWWQRHPDLAIVLSLAAVALALMAPYILQPEVLAWPRSDLGTDFLNYRWAHVYWLRHALAEHGQVPLWRRSTMGGEPVIGNPAVMLFYPPQLIVALLPLPILSGFALLTALHLWIAGVGSYCLLHGAIGTRRLAALVAAVAMLLAPRLISNAVGDLGLAYAMCWVPFCLAWAKLALDRAHLSWAILAGMGLAFQFLIHVHIFFYTAWTIGLMFLYGAAAAFVRRVSGRARTSLGALGRRWLAQLGLLALMAVVCAGLVAFELLPFITYLPHLSRASLTLAEGGRYALPPVMLLSAVMPSPPKFPEWELYVGLLPLALLFLSVHHPRRGETVFWMGLAIFAILFSLGTTTPLFAFLFTFVPGFSWLRVPARMWWLAAVAATTLTGLAVDALAMPSLCRRWGRRWRGWMVVSGWALALTTVVGRYVTRHPGNPDWLLGFAGVLGLALGVGGVLMWAEGNIRYRTFGALLVVALLLDLLPVDVAYIAPLAVDRAFEMPAIGHTLLAARGRTPFRVYAVRGEVPYHVAVAEGLEVIDGINSFQFASYVRLVAEASGCALSGFAASVPSCLTNEISDTAYLDAVPDPALLGLLNVRYVVTPLPLDAPAWVQRDTAPGEYLYENLLVQPRAFAVRNVEVLGDEEALWRRLSQIDVSTVALVSAKDARHRSWPAAQEPFHVPADLVTSQPNRIVVDVVVNDGDALLVFSEVWTPGWQAFDNGVPVEVLRVDGALRGVLLSASTASDGAHRVVLRFVPPAFAWGLGISAVAVLACTVLLWAERSIRP
jgi:hypothetical protein